MYLLFGIFIFICILFSIIFFIKRNCIIKKICRMNFCEKVELLDSILAPFGFCFIPKQEVVTSRLDAWQKAFGYCSLFDRSALHFNMVFDCEPVYFHYCGQTWLIQFWKGQYGINIGGEIGIYRTDGIIPMEDFHKTVFYGVPDDERFPTINGIELQRSTSLFDI